jgi:Rps23 Pro-64 3,4-dihydroxylase Tpa1-like proline 4-hydroxylase
LKKIFGTEFNKKTMKRDYLANLILEKLISCKEILSYEFNQNLRINSCFIDDLLPEDVAVELYNAFPSPEEMAIHKSLRENKRIAAQMDLYNPILEEIVYAFQDIRIVDIIEEITGLKEMTPDKYLYAGGISLMSTGNFLNPHIDNSHDNDRENYRVLNLLYYVTPNWAVENGGNLELWDNGMSNYYFSKKPAEASEYFHVTSFYGRPEEPVRDIILRCDAFLRQTIRKIMGKRIVETKHIYKK